MFEGVEAIDWKAKGDHVYGKHERIPVAIRNLLADDPEVVVAAAGFLLADGQDSGGIYDTTAHIIPFVLQALEVQPHIYTLSLLESVARAAAQVPQRDRSVRHRRNLLATYDAIKAGFLLYETLLHHPHPAVRRLAANILTTLNDHAEESAAVLRERISMEDEEHLRAHFIRRLGKLMAMLTWRETALIEKQMVYLVSLVEAHEQASTRVAAAHAVLDSYIDHASGEILTGAVGKVLVDAFQQRGKMERGFNYRVFSQGGVYDPFEIVRSLARWHWNPQPLMQLATLDHLDDKMAQLVGRGLLCAALLRDQLTHEQFWVDAAAWWYEDVNETGAPFQQALGSPLRTTQEIAINALLDLEQFWQSDSHYVSRNFALPDDREAFRKRLRPNEKK